MFDANHNAVIDWIDDVEAILAARDAVTQLGGDVVGASFVVATRSHLLQILKAAQIPFSCSWTPPFGGELSIGTRHPGTYFGDFSPNCICDRSSPRSKQDGQSQTHNSNALASKTSFRLSYFTAQYEVCMLLRCIVVCA